MHWTLNLGAAAALLAAGGGMVAFEIGRARSGRPFLRGHYSQVGYWMTYLSLLVLGAAFALATAIR